MYTGLKTKQSKQLILGSYSAGSDKIKHVSLYAKNEENTPITLTRVRAKGQHSISFFSKFNKNQSKFTSCVWNRTNDTKTLNGINYSNQFIDVLSKRSYQILFLIGPNNFVIKTK